MVPLRMLQQLTDFWSHAGETKNLSPGLKRLKKYLWQENLADALNYKNMDSSGRWL